MRRQITAQDGAVGERLGSFLIELTVEGGGWAWELPKESLS